MYRVFWKVPTTIVLLAGPLGAQARAGNIGTIIDPALGTRVSIETVQSAGRRPASILVTVFNPAQPTVARLSLARAASLVRLSDSVLALPARIGAGESLYFRIFDDPLDSGSTITTGRFVSDLGDLMQVQVSTASNSAVAVLSRKAAESFIGVLGQAVATVRAPRAASVAARPKADLVVSAVRRAGVP